MSTTSFKTRSGTSYSTQISVDKDVTGATLTVEFARTSKFGSVILSKSATATGRVVQISLTSSEVDTLKDSYFRVKSVLGGVTEYVHFGTVDYTYVAVATPPIAVNDVVNSTELKAALVPGAVYANDRTTIVQTKRLHVVLTADGTDIDDLIIETVG